MLTVATPIGVGRGLLVPPLLIGAGATLVAGMLEPRPADRPSPWPAPRWPSWAVPPLGATTTGRGLDGGPRCARRAGCPSVGSAGSGMRAARLRAGTLYGSRDDRGAADRGAAPPPWSIAATAGAAVAYAAPADRVALRAVVQSPVDPAAFPSPLGDFRRYTKDSADDVQLLVTGLPAGTRLRLAALDAYDGTQFAASDGEGPFVRIGQRREPQFAGAATTVRVEIAGYAGSVPAGAGRADHRHLRRRAARTELTDGLRYSGAAATGLVPGGLPAGRQLRRHRRADRRRRRRGARRRAPRHAVPFPATAPLPDLLRRDGGAVRHGVRGAAAQVEAIRAGPDRRRLLQPRPRRASRDRPPGTDSTG